MCAGWEEQACALEQGEDLVWEVDGLITIIPAIDLKGGRCVRLQQGRADDSTVYSDDPSAMARRWAREGARRLHVVDLDGAFAGERVHAKAISEIAAAIDIPVEVGGGLRTDEDVRALLGSGVEDAVIGTRAVVESDALGPLLQEFGSHIWVGIDARDGLVQVKGWVETSSRKAVDLAASVSGLGVSTIIYTDTATDGMMTGVNARAVDEICRNVSCNVIASGGISSVEDVAALRALGRPNLVGAIVGKALYEGTVSFGELIGAAEE